MKRQIVRNTDFSRSKYFLEQVALFFRKTSYSPPGIHRPIQFNFTLFFWHDSILYTKLTRYSPTHSVHFDPIFA